MRFVIPLMLVISSTLLMGEIFAGPSENQLVKLSPQLLPADATVREAIDEEIPLQYAVSDVTTELLCRGISNPNRRIALFQVDNELWGRVYEGSELVGSGVASKTVETSGSGATQQTRASYRAGKIFDGGFNIRIVIKYETFPEREGTGNATVRVDGRMTNDTINCFRYPTN